MKSFALIVGQLGRYLGSLTYYAERRMHDLELDSKERSTQGRIKGFRWNTL